MDLDILNSEMELLARKQAGRSLQELLDVYAQEYTQGRKESYIGEPKSEIPTEEEFIQSGKDAAQAFYNEVAEYFAAIEEVDIREEYEKATALGMTREVFLLLLRNQVWKDFRDDADLGNVGEEVDIQSFCGFDDNAFEIIRQVFERKMEEITGWFVKN